MDEFEREQNETNGAEQPGFPAQDEPAPLPDAEQPAAAPADEPPQAAPPAGAPQPPYGYPQPPYPNYYPYPPVMQNPYPQPAPPRRGMPTGLKVLLIVMSVLFAGSVVGFAVYGVYAAVTNYTTESHAGMPFYDPEFPRGDGEEADGDDEEAELPEESTRPAPDIEITPNTEGITLHSTPDGGELDVSAVYDKVIPSTVLVITEGESGGTGTGIIATEDGYIITNSHVVLNSRSVSVQVKTNDGVMHDAVVVGCDKTTDLAVLKIDGNGYTPAEFGDSDDLKMGQWVVAIGNPGGEQFSGSLTRGVISGLNRSVGSYSDNGMTYIQTDAAINPGNSGGPLVNLYGQVVGINSSKIVSEQYEGMGFAIPITGAQHIINDLLSGGYVQGRVRFGIKGTAISELQAAMYDVPQGFMISEIDEDSSFIDTEVQEYDIITAIDDAETPTLDALSNALLSYSPGDSVRVTLFRPNETGKGGEEFEVTVILLEDKGETQG
ncbi:MAG: S1C family serine protease [Hominenteromicrobium sp.]